MMIAAKYCLPPVETNVDVHFKGSIFVLINMSQRLSENALKDSIINNFMLYYYTENQRESEVSGCYPPVMQVNIFIFITVMQLTDGNAFSGSWKILSQNIFYPVTG